MSEADPRLRVRQLLLSGDNIRKHREGPEAETRARERYAAALDVARSAGLDAPLVAIIEARLADSDGPRGR